MTLAARLRLPVLITALLLLVLGVPAFDSAINSMAARGRLPLPDGLLNFSTVFLGIVIEAMPFLLLGSLASGLMAEFVSRDDLLAVIPKNAVLATLCGALIGIIFPACECGVVPLARRLRQKGLPLSACVALLLGAPVLNPIVIASTYAAFGSSVIFWGRLGFTLVIATGVGCLFLLAPEDQVVVPGNWQGHDHGERSATGLRVGDRLSRAVQDAGTDFLDTARYLILGALVATALQQFVSQSLLLSAGHGVAGNSLALIALAYVLSVCSTVDSFLALTFVNNVGAGPVVAFLVFGAMIDIKSTIMFLGLFRRRTVIYLIVILALAALLAALLVG